VLKLATVDVPIKHPRRQGRGTADDSAGQDFRMASDAKN
jgi:hypothetical protein